MRPLPNYFGQSCRCYYHWPYPTDFVSFFSTTYALLKTALNILYTHYAQFTLPTQQNCGASLCWQCKLGIKYFIRDYNTIVYGLMNY